MIEGPTIAQAVDEDTLHVQQAAMAVDTWLLLEQVDTPKRPPHPPRARLHPQTALALVALAAAGAIVLVCVVAAAG